MRPDSIRFGTGGFGLERAEVHISAGGFEPHRHDTYALGVTTAGVQRFRYLGADLICLPGQLHILHPDETHDGTAGTSDGFSYRILYLAPELIREALGDHPLPFVASPVHALTPATRPVAALLDDIDELVSDLAQAEIIAAVADTLRFLSGRPGGPATAIDIKAVGLVREYLRAHASEQTPASAPRANGEAPPSRAARSAAPTCPGWASASTAVPARGWPRRVTVTGFAVVLVDAQRADLGAATVAPARPARVLLSGYGLAARSCACASHAAASRSTASVSLSSGSAQDIRM